MYFDDITYHKYLIFTTPFLFKAIHRSHIIIRLTSFHGQPQGAPRIQVTGKIGAVGATVGAAVPWQFAISQGKTSFSLRRNWVN